MSEAREEAIQDCKYAKQCEGSALSLHIAIWSGATGVTGDDIEYRNTINEIKEKLGTEQCLLK